MEKDFRLFAYGGGGVLAFQFPVINSANRPFYLTGFTDFAVTIERTLSNGSIVAITPTYTLAEIGTSGRYLFSMSHDATGNTIDPTDEEITVTIESTGSGDPQCIKIENEHNGFYDKDYSQCDSSKTTIISGAASDTKTRYGSNFVVAATPSEFRSFINFSYYLEFNETPVALQVVARAPKTTDVGGSYYWWDVVAANRYGNYVDDTLLNEQNRIWVAEPSDSFYYEYLNIVLPLNNTHKSIDGDFMASIISSAQFGSEYQLDIAYVKLIVEKNGCTIGHSMSYSDLRSSVNGLKITKSAIDTIDGKIDTINSELAVTKGYVLTNTQLLNFLTDDVTAVKGVVDTINTNTDTVEASLAAIEAAVVGAIPELTRGRPVAEPTLKEAIMLLYMALRNQKYQTASLKTFTNDAGNTICVADTTDNGSTLSISELYDPS